MTQNILLAFGLTLFAGLSTGIGSILALLTNRTNTKVLSVALGFSAGVMIYISFMEILPDAQEALVALRGERLGTIYSLLAFFGGMLLIALIDKMIPSYENPHEMKKIEEMSDAQKAHDFRKLYRMGIITALAVGIHNFPEGLATFVAAMNNPSTGIVIAIAIAIHNIPEGIAVSIPVYYATNSRKKAFWFSFLSGLSEPIGAILGYLLLMLFITPENMDLIFGYILAGVAGIMVFISFDELLPSAQEYGEHHLSIYGLIAGMVLMEVSLLLLH